MAKTISFSKTVLILVFLLLIVIAVGFYLFTNNFGEDKVVQNSTDSEAEELVEKVGKLILLPSGTPQIATVTDKTQLEGQSFFLNAQNGDKVLIFPESKKAILYRPSVNRVIEVGPVEANIEESLPLEAEVATPTVVVLNGTKTSGLARKGADQITSAGGFEVISTGNTNSDYESSLVIVNNSIYLEKAEELAEMFGANISDLPEEESEHSSDIIVLLGSNYD